MSFVAFGGDEGKRKAGEVVCDGEVCAFKKAAKGGYRFGDVAERLHPAAADMAKRLFPKTLQSGVETAINATGTTAAAAKGRLSGTARSVKETARRWKKKAQRLGHSTMNLTMVYKEPLRIHLQRGIADEIYGTKPTRLMPKYSDIDSDIYARIIPERGPYARHVVIFGVYGFKFLSHHAVEVFEDPRTHYVVQWSMGSEAGMTPEEKKAKDDRIHAAMNNHDDLKKLFKEGRVMVQLWSEFVAGWNEASPGGKARFSYRVYERGFTSPEIIARLKAYMQCNTLGECNATLDKTFVRFPEEEGWNPYSVTNNNCEHFANYICCGVHASKQTQQMQELMLYQRKVRGKPAAFITKDPDERFVPPLREWQYTPTAEDIQRAVDAIALEQKPRAEVLNESTDCEVMFEATDDNTSVVSEPVSDDDEDGVAAHMAFLNMQ